jgi:hypothetical protein
MPPNLAELLRTEARWPFASAVSDAALRALSLASAGPVHGEATPTRFLRKRCRDRFGNEDRCTAAEASCRWTARRPLALPTSQFDTASSVSEAPRRNRSASLPWPSIMRRRHACSAAAWLASPSSMSRGLPKRAHWKTEKTT